MNVVKIQSVPFQQLNHVKLSEYIKVMYGMLFKNALNRENVNIKRLLHVVIIPERIL